MPISFILKTHITKKAWSPATTIHYSWLRPTYHAHLIMYSDPGLIGDLIPGLVASAKSNENKDILHTTVLAFGLILRDIKTSIQIRADAPVDPPLILKSPPALTEKELAIADSALAELMIWAGHGGSVATEAKRSSKPTLKAAAGGSNPKKGRK